MGRVTGDYRRAGMMTVMTPVLGAYLLPGDPVWLRSSLARYYALLDDLVVVVPVPATGWTGRPLPVDECLEIIAAVDVRGIARQVTGHWEDRGEPMRADTAQRQAGLDALAGRVDWVLQIDNDEVLPDPGVIMRAIESAGPDVRGIELPLRVLYRRLGPRVFAAITGSSGHAVVEYPGSNVVRSGAVLVHARRPSGHVVRHVVRGDKESLQVRRVTDSLVTQVEDLDPSEVILHNSWGRKPREILRKTRSWGHASGARGLLYVVTRWWVSRWLWRWQRNLHPFEDGLWPRLRQVTVPPWLLDERDA